MKRFIVPTFTAIVLAFSINTHAQFTAGNIVVERLGTGSAALSSAGTAIFVDQYTPTGTLVNSTAIPIAVSGSIIPVTESGTGTSDAQMGLSNDGQYLILPGYNATPGTAGVTGSSTINRALVRVDYAGNIITQPLTVATTYNANNMRSATYDACTGNAYTAGTGTASNYGIRYFGSFTSANSTAVATTAISTSPITNTRVVKIFNGNLFFSTGSAPIGIYMVGSGLPTALTTATQIITANTTNSSPYEFTIVSLGTNQFVCYVADDGSGTGGTGGIYKYYATSLSGTWTYAGKITGANTSGVTASVSGSTVTIFCCSASAIYKVTDVNAYNAAPSTTTLPASIATASTNEAFRSIALAPAQVAANKQASSVTFSSVLSTSMTINWAAGSGTGSLVYLSTSPITSSVAPSNGTAPSTANAAYSGGTQLVYSGTGTSIPVTGLTPGVTYYAKVYADNYATDVTLNLACSYVYRTNDTTSVAGSNPNSQTTTVAPTLTANNLSSVSLTGFNTVNGTASASQNFALVGTDLIGTNVVLTAPTGYELSLNGSSWSTTLTLSNGTSTPYNYTSPNLTATVYARIAASASLGAVSGTITFGALGGGVATPPTVSLSGNDLAAIPTTQATNITFSGVTSTTFNVSWTNGNGAGRIVVVRPNSATNVVPIYGNDYSATQNLNIGSAATTGTNNYVVYSGTGSGPITVTGLSASTLYNVEVYEFNGSTASINYNTTAATGNPNTQMTLVPTYLWDGSSPSTTVSHAPSYGSGTWNTATANWLSSNPGLSVVWPNINTNAANFAGTAGTVVVSGTSATPLTAYSVNVNTTGYIFSAPAASSYLTTSSTQGITLGSNVGLTVNPNSFNFFLNSNVSQAAATTGGSLTLTCNQNASYGLVGLQGNSTISVPVNLVNTGTQQFGLVTNGNVANPVISGGINLNQGSGAGNFFIGVSSAVTNSFTLSGAITGTGDIAVANGPISASAGGKGILWLSPISSGQNTFTGNIYMEANATLGFLRACSASGISGIPSTSSVIWDFTGTGGTLDLYGGNVLINELSQTSATALGGVSNSGTVAATLTVNQSTSTTYGTTGTASLVISDGTAKTGLTMAGSGVLTLSGANTYTGATTVSGGSVFVDNTTGLASGSAVTVSSGGTIGGSGTAAGTLSLTGTVSPGSGVSPTVGNFITGAQTWHNGATYKFDISNVAGTAGTDWDLLTSTGALDLSSGNYTIDLTGNPTGYSSASTYSWTIASAASITGFSASRFTIITSNFTPTVNGVLAVTQVGNTIVLNYTPSGLSATPGSFTGMSTIQGTASAPVNFSLTGSSLTGADVMLTAPANFEISLSSGSGYGSSITLTSGSGNYSGATLGATTIYARISASASLGAVSGNIDISGGGTSTPIAVSLDGTVSVAAPTTQAINVIFSGATAASLTFSWTNGNGSGRVVVIRPSSATNVVPASGIVYTANTNIASAGTTGINNYVVYSGTGSGPITVTGLSSLTTYFVEVYEFNGSGSSTNYLTTTAPQNPNSDATTAPAYYWNGGTPTAGTNVTANGGTGAWLTTNAWVQPTTPGTGSTWVTSNNAVFAGTAGVVTLPTSAITATNSTFSVTGYTLTASGTETFNSPISLGAGVNLNFAPNLLTTLTYNGSISGGAGSGITMSGSTLTGTNYVRVSLATASSSISVPITINLTGTGTATNLVGLVATATGVSLSGNVTLNGAVGGARAMLNATSGNSIAISGQITGTGDIQFSAGTSGGAGTLSLSNTGNNFSGNLYMIGATNGLIQASAGAGSCVPSTMSVFYPTASQGGIFDIHGSDVIIAGLSQTAAAQGSITNRGASAATLTINQNTNSSFGSIGNLTTGDSISDGTSKLALTKSGTGILTLAGKNTYTGATNINGGSLLINNASGSGLASGSAVTVSAAGTIGGSGTVAGTLSLSGTVSPGATASPTIGNFTTGAQTWANGANYKFDISNVVGIAGTNWDLLTSTGAADVSTGSYTIDLSGNPTGFSSTSAYSWTFLTAGSISGFNSSSFIILTTNFVPAFTGIFSVSQSGNTLLIKYCPAATASNTGPYIPGQTISVSSGPSGQTGYSWHGPSGYSALTENFTRTGATSAMSGTYTVTVTASNGCSATASTVVAVNGLGDYTWTGATNNSWTTVTNWVPTAPVGGPNNCTENVIIPNTVNDPVISSAISIGNITINDNASLTLNGSLSVCGFLAGGTTTPPLIVGTSHLILNSSTAAQAVSGILSVNYLEISNTAPGTWTAAGIWSTANITVNKALIMTQGNFYNTTGSVSLASNASGDAYLDNFTSGSAGTYSGNLTVQRYISNTSDGYRDLGSAVNTTVNDLNNAYPVSGQNFVECWYAYSPYPNVQTYNETLIIPSANGSVFGHWTSYTSLGERLSPMMGYAFRTYKGSSYTISFTGQPNSGAYTQGITHTSSAIPANDGWNFLSNPYPSPIKWSLVKAMNAAVVNGEYYVYNTTGEFTGNWGTYNGTTGVNGAIDEISSSQGFFVQAPSATTFRMDNTVRTTNTSGQYFGASPVLDNEVRLVLTGAGNSDEIVTYTDAQATDGYDADLDAVKMPAGSTVGISYRMPDHDYAINVMNTINAQTELPLSITVSDTGAYTLNATILNVPGLTAYLRDAESRQNISLTSLANGPVTLNLNGGQTYSGRYSVVFQPIATTGIINTEASATRIYSYEDKVYIARSSSTPAVISVTNLLGQDVADVNTDTQQTEFELPSVQPWYAIVKVTEENGKVTVGKVLISGKQ